MERTIPAKRLVLNRETVKILKDTAMDRAHGVNLPTSECTGIWPTLPVATCLSRDVYPCP